MSEKRSSCWITARGSARSLFLPLSYGALEGSLAVRPPTTLEERDDLVVGLERRRLFLRRRRRLRGLVLGFGSHEVLVYE